MKRTLQEETQTYSFVCDEDGISNRWGKNIIASGWYSVLIHIHKANIINILRARTHQFRKHAEKNKTLRTEQLKTKEKTNGVNTGKDAQTY